jgi:hypothetical protein
MGILYQMFTFEQIIGFVLLLSVIVLLNEITRRSLKASIAVYCILPVLLALGVYFGFLGSPSGKAWFGWVKVISALAGVYGFLFIRFTKLGNRKFAYYFPVAILALNIAEAVYREFQVFATYKIQTVDASGILVAGGVWNILNGIAGILCIITLTGFVGIKVSRDKSKDMIWPDMTWIYVVGYTIWNFAYVYNCLSTRSLYAGFTILTAALLAELFLKRGAWLQHRAQTLSMFAMFSLSVDYHQLQFLNAVPVYSEQGLLGLSIVSIVVNVLVFVSMLWVMVKYKKNPYSDEIYSHTQYYKKTLEVNQLY